MTGGSPVWRGVGYRCQDFRSREGIVRVELGFVRVEWKIVRVE
jgi:hypothetical protein